MPSPKSGNAANLVSPTGPQDAQEADNADPGQVDQLKLEQKASGTGKYGSTPVQTFKKSGSNGSSDPADTQNNAEEKKKVWIEIAATDDDGNILAGERYRITMPDGTVDEGTLDDKGCARVEGIDPGSCQVTFPEREDEGWKKN